MIGRRALLGGLGAGLASTMGNQLVAATAPVAGDVPGLWSPSVSWMNLWPGVAPDAGSRLPVEVINRRPATDPPILEITGIARPRLMVLRPARPNGSAALVIPGGGYARLVVASNGPEIARWLMARGWTVFVLLYRLPGEGWLRRPDVPLQDAQRAIRLIRHKARTFAIDPGRVAAIGFSAGGHLCADLATRSGVQVYAAVDAADAMSARPELAVPVYPVQTLSDPYAHRGSRDRLLGPNPSPMLVQAHSPESNVTAGAPPFLIIHAEDDPTVSVENSLRLRAALKAKNVRVETHLFPDGAHGFGIKTVAKTTTSRWPELIVEAARTYGLG